MIVLRKEDPPTGGGTSPGQGILDCIKVEKRLERFLNR